jgi:hypothetical protein
MKNLKLYLAAAMAVLFAGCVHAQDGPQENPKAKLVEAISTTDSSCEHRRAVMDTFLSELSNNPSAQGYVVIYRITLPVWLAKSRSNELRKHLEMRRFDASRVTIVEGSSQGDPEIEFWLVPPGAENPELKEFDGVVNGPPMEQVTKPKNFTEANPDHCLWGELYLEEYATEMNWGWEYPGRIVIYAKNLAAFQKRKQELITELAKFEVPAKRLTFLRKPALRGEEWVELWILPVKKGTKPTIELPGM